MPGVVTGKILRLCEIAPDELGDVAQFIARQQLHTQAGLTVQQVAARLRWIILENPAREPGMPVGWCTRDEHGSITGCMCCAPQKFISGGNVITLMMSSSFYVDERYRGTGVSIFMKFLQLGKRYALFVSSANPAVAEMWKKLGAFPIGDSEHEMLGMRRWRGVVEDTLVRRLGNNSFTRVLTLAGTAVLSTSKRLRRVDGIGDLRPIDSPEEAALLCATSSFRLTCLRDVAYLRWRYFSEVDSSTRLFTFRPVTGQGAYMIATNLRQRGYRGQITAVNILDVFPEPSPDIYPAIASALVQQHGNQSDLLVLRCLSQGGRQALRHMGFVRRQFAAPIAWCLDKFQNLPSRDWYFVPADGDMLL